MYWLTLQDERADELVWDALYDKSVELAHDVGVDPSMPRYYGRHRHMPNAHADTPSQYWKANMYLPFVDHLLSELDIRLLQGHARYKVQYLIPTKVYSTNARYILMRLITQFITKHVLFIFNSQSWLMFIHTFSAEQ